MSVWIANWENAESCVRNDQENYAIMTHLMTVKRERRTFHFVMEITIESYNALVSIQKEYEIVGGRCGVAFIIEAENNEFIRDGINIGQLLENLNYKVQTIKLKVGEVK